VNSFGRAFRMSILGESHGSCVGILLDGCPAGLPLDPSDFAADMERRRGGSAPGTTPRREDDTALIQTGILEGRTTGAPILVLFGNKNTDSSSYEAIKDTPRPGHADWVALKKYGGFADMRGSGHFSGRLTAGLVAAGVIAKKLLAPVRVEARLLEAGGKADIERAIQEAMPPAIPWAASWSAACRACPRAWASPSSRAWNPCWPTGPSPSPPSRASSSGWASGPAACAGAR
jgi:chorismate synthase